ncbi:unnamed protein product [Paramecium pentaurelia]|uniref:Transmembrane protein n=1 Tax=Paramecium pentaurelia TaxID=43138 RepID=A0A8S1TQB8_9CILI|nr:unnamed protein product [Paramecium pentaurelia]
MFLASEKKGLTFIEQYITMMIILKKQHQLTRLASAIIIVIPYIQLLILTLDLRLSENTKKESIHFQIVKSFIRPDIWLIEKENEQQSLLFIIVLVIMLFQKAKLIIIVILYYYILNQDNLLAHLQNNFYIKIPIVILSLYQQIISLILYQWCVLICVCSIKNLFDQIVINQQFLNLFLIFLVLLTLILVVLDNILHIKVIEKPITMKIQGLERKNTSTLRYVSLIIEFIVQFLYIFQKDQPSTLHLLIGLSLLKCCLDLFDQFTNYVFVNGKLIKVLICGISFSIIVNFLIEIIELQDKYGSRVIFQTLVLTPILFQILLKYYQIDQKQNLVTLFNDQIVSPKRFIYHITSILNEQNFEFCTIQRSLIQQYHYKKCQNLSCSICGHQYILDTRSAQGITIEIFKEFIQSRLIILLKESLKLNFTDQQSCKKSKRRFLSYVFLLYDFGWIMQSLQYLHQLKNAQLTQQSNLKGLKNHLGTLPQSNSYSDRNSHYVTGDNQTNLSQPQNIDANMQYQINILLNQIKFSMLESIFISVTLEEARRTIQKNFGTDDYVQQQSITSDFVTQYLLNEVQVQQSINIIINLVKQKIKFYEDMMKIKSDDKKVNFWDNHQSYQNLIEKCKQFNEGESKIIDMYNIHPSYILHQALNVFYCFIQNDYEKAMQFSRSQKFLDERQLKFLKIKNFNVNSKDIYYLIMTLQDDMQHFNILTHSNQLFDLFGVFRNKGENYQFEDLIPLAVVNYHHHFVGQFLETGQCKFFKIFDINFIVTKDQFIQAIYLNVDVTELFVKSNLTFSAFFQPPTEDLMFILVDGVKHQCLFTKSILNQIGWNSEQILWFKANYDINKISIESIMPDFLDILESLIKLTETSLSQIEIIFPKPPDKLSQKQFDFQSLKNIRNSYFRSNTIQNIKYICDLTIRKRQISNYVYYVMHISYIQKQQNVESNLENSTNRQRSNIINDCDFDSEINDLELKNRNQIFQEFQKQVNDSSKQMQRNIKLFSNYTNDQIQEEILSPGRICITNHNNQDKNDINEFKELLNSNKDNQQQYFCHDDQIKDCSSYELIISQFTRKQVKQQKTKTLNDISKDSLWKKYDIIHRIMQNSKPKYIVHFLIYTFLLLISFLVIPIFIMYEFNKDLNLLIEQIEMLQLHASIMGPHDLFFSMRITVTSYQIQYREGFINAKELQVLTTPFLQYLPLGYQELQDNFYTQLTNPYLAQFLNDVTIPVWFMGENSSVIYSQNVTFRDNLFIMLSYQQQQLSAYMFNRAIAGQPFQVFLIANYLIMQNTCESLTREIKVYSEQKCNQIYIKWSILLTCFVFVFIFLLLIVFYYQRKYFASYDLIIGLLRHNTDEIILNEISRQKILLNIISATMLDEFHLEKEYFMIIKIQNSTENAKQNQLMYHKYAQQYPQYKYNIANIIFLLLIIIYGIIVFVQAQQYLTKYNVTTDFFKLIQDLKFRGGNGFLYRELFFRFSSYPFLTKSDQDNLYILLNRSQNVLQEFNSLIETIHYDDYLLTQNFIDLLELVQVNEMCSQVDENFKPLMDQYCQLSFEGILSKGIVPTLSYLYNQIQTQQQMNNFTKRVEMHKYELEGAQIITRAFFALSNSFRSSFKEITEETLKQLNNVSISYLVFCGITILALILLYPKYLFNQYQLLKRIVYFIPLQIFLRDGYLERNLKEILIKQI